MKIIEIYKTIQGEGGLTGVLTTFIRTAGCNMRCVWCDTPFSWNKEMKKLMITMTPDEIVADCKERGAKHICITGGEPMLQKDLAEVVNKLRCENFHVSIFTNGTLPLAPIHCVDKWCVDYKLKSAKDNTPFYKPNFNFLRNCDELKFVVADESDFDEVLEILSEEKTNAKVLISPCLDGKVNHNAIKIAERIIKENLNVRYSLQLHTILWGNKRGV